MSLNFSLFVDDQNPNIHYLCPTVNQVVMGSYYNNTWSSPDGDECEKGWWEYSFSGIGVEVFASVAYPGQSYSVKLDDGDFVAQSGNGSYKSPALTDGMHKITYGIGPGNATSFQTATFDYLTVTAGPSTSLNGQDVVVDNQDSALTFSGNWRTSPPVNLQFDPSTSLYENTTHWSSSVGDTVEFKFLGSSISVYGILANISTGGNITATYSIDGNVTTQSLGKGTFEFLPMIELFHADVASGNHTLLMNITNIAPTQSLGVDFITYDSAWTTNPGATAAAKPTTNSGTPSWAPRAGMIVGVVAGTALLLGGLIILWQRMRLRRTNLKHQRLEG